MGKNNTSLNISLLVSLSLLTVGLQRGADCQTQLPTLPLNITLASNQTLLSQGGGFEMGFYSKSSTYTLAIWYAQLPAPKTVVWMADRALNLSSNASLLLSALGNLEVYEQGAGQPLWVSNTLNLNVTEGVMLDTGNFVLHNSSQHIVWQSFDSPTDTLLPGQVFSANQHRTIFSWKNAEDWTAGLYSLNWTDGSLLNAAWASPYPGWEPNASPSYWQDGITSSSATLTPAGQFVVINETTNVKRVLGNCTDNEGSTTLCRMTLDVDGNLRIYSWVVGIPTAWAKKFSLLADSCQVFGICGPNAVCKSSGQCICPDGFKFVDETNRTEGCERVIPKLPNCNSSAVETMSLVQFTDYHITGYLQVLYNKTNTSDCLQYCLSTCNCTGVVLELLDEQFRCWIKKDVLLNGRFTENRQTYLKIGLKPGQHKSSFLLAGVSISLGIIVILLGTTVCAFVTIFARRELVSLRIRWLAEKWGASRGTTTRFTYKELQIATSNFSEEIGKGGYGSVYKGELGHNHTLVAVKRLDTLSAGEKAFMNEVDTIGRIHHVNLVQLHGYCLEKEHWLLVYEYLERSSLDRALFRGDKHKGLPTFEWRSRFKVAIETAKGLAYLHDEVSDQRIIHCDVKPENILMDHMFTAKVADFGLSRILNREQTRTMTLHIRGTCGYMAPEWSADHIPITAKTDVYSYGMLLLEIVSGRRNLQTSEAALDSPDWYFPLWAYPRVERGEFLEVVDPSLTGIVDVKQVERALQVAFWCILEQPEMRPSMEKVVHMLQGDIAIQLPIPKPIFLETMMLTEQQRSFDMLTNSERDEKLMSSSHSHSSATDKKR